MAETIGKLINIEKRLIPKAKKQAAELGLKVKPYFEQIIQKEILKKGGATNTTS